MKTTLICIFFIICKISAMPQIDTSFITTTDVAKTTLEITDKEVKGKPEQHVEPKIYQMNIDSKISNRYANTTITSKVRNLGDKSKEATFFVILPDSAYISGFIMEIDGKNYTAYVQEKAKAQETYDQAVSQGIGAAHIAASARDSNKFTVSINIEPKSKATFYLNYEELLKRRNGYEMVINIHPKQPVPNLEVNVEISESSPIKYVKAPAIRSGNDVRPVEGDLDSRAVINKVNDTYAIVSFKPSEERQKQLAQVLGTKEDEGLSGQFVVQYEIEREKNGGEILLKDGHFVHFFSPDDIELLPKYVLFVLDTSGSMYGNKITQLKQAMRSILSELGEQDAFSLIEFSSQVKVWDIQNENKSVLFPSSEEVWNYNSLNSTYDDLKFPAAYVPTKENIKKAKTIVNNFLADGGTNIFDALKIGLHLHDLELNKNKDFNKQPLIVFLTDGQPNVGVFSEEIVAKIPEFNLKSVPIFSLSFGEGADQKFLRKLSLKNSAFSRHIYEASDASLQLENFFKQISSPLLKNVHFKYTQDVKEVSKTEFPVFFRGGEYIIAGKTDKEFKELPDVEAWGVHGPIHLKPIIKRPTGELERLWAYLTIKQLFEAKETAKNKTVYEEKALSLALKYSFVTPVSSLVVVKPNQTDAINTEAADKKHAPRRTTYPRISSPPLTGNIMPMSGVWHRPAASSAHRSFMSLAYPKLSSPVFYRPAIYTTNSPSTSTYLPERQNLIKKLPWLQSIINQNDTITLPNGQYKLGFHDVVDESKVCDNAYNNTTGHCKLLHNCNHIVGQNLVTTIETYKKHFCNIDEYAGVCCPDVQ